MRGDFDSPIETPALNLQFQAGTYEVASDGLLFQRYDARPGTTYLVRPDQHVAARWRALDVEAVRAALGRALGNA